MQPTRPEDALLTDAFADFLEKCRAKNLSEKTLNIYTVHFKFFREYLSDPDKKASDITEDTLEGFILRTGTVTTSPFSPICGEYAVSAII